MWAQGRYLGEKNGNKIGNQITPARDSMNNGFVSDSGRQTQRNSACVWPRGGLHECLMTHPRGKEGTDVKAQAIILSFQPLAMAQSGI